MSNPLDRRVIRLEAAPEFRRCEIRCYATEAEAEADVTPSAPRMEVLQIITGVPRAAEDAT
jgi:hypothetical protein